MNSKKQIFNLIYFSLSGMVFFVVLFLVSYFSVKNSLKNNLTISSIVLICLTLLAILLELGWLDKSQKKYQTWKEKRILVKQDETIMKLNPKDLKNKKLIFWSAISLNLTIYLIILIIGLTIL